MVGERSTDLINNLPLASSYPNRGGGWLVGVYLFYEV